MVIMTTSPLFSALMARIWLAERLTSLQVTGMIVTLAGVAWVVLADRSAGVAGQRRTVTKGLVIALLGSMTQAIAYILVGMGMRDSVSAVSANVIRLFWGLVALIIFSLVRRSLLTDFSRFAGKAARHSLLLILLAAIIGPVLGIILNLQALKMAPVGVVTTLSQLTPVMLLPLERFVMKRPVRLAAAMGTVIAVGGSVMLFI